MLSVAGDFFLGFLANELGIRIEYKNHSGFISCFVLRSIRLKGPVFFIKDFDLALGSQKALIEPDFREFIQKKVIILKCELVNASFLDVKERLGKTDEVLEFFKGGMPPMLDRLINVLFDSINTTLVIHKDWVEFLPFDARGKDVKIYASGSVAEAGDLNIEAKILFSPEIVKEFSEELRELLTETSDGWLSYRMHIEGGREKAFLKFDSDRLKIEFEKIEVR